MKEALEAYITNRLGKKPDQIELVLSHFKEMKVKKNTVLLEVNEVCRHVYFVVSGCLKIGTYNYNGDESTTSLCFENEWRTSIRSFINQQASNERIVAVEHSEVLQIGRDQFLFLKGKLPNFENIYNALIEESYTKSIERVQTLMNMDALDRLKWCLEVHPLIFTRLSNRLIASYLGLSEATLSRLKSKL